MSDGKIKYMLNAFDVIIICSYAELVKAAACSASASTGHGREEEEGAIIAYKYIGTEQTGIGVK